MSAATIIKKQYLIGMAYIFRGLFHCHQVVTQWDAGRYDAGAVVKDHLDLQPQCMWLEHL